MKSIIYKFAIACILIISLLLVSILYYQLGSRESPYLAEVILDEKRRYVAAKSVEMGGGAVGWCTVSVALTDLVPPLNWLKAITEPNQIKVFEMTGCDENLISMNLSNDSLSIHCEHKTNSIAQQGKEFLIVYESKFKGLSVNLHECEGVFEDNE